MAGHIFYVGVYQGARAMYYVYAMYMLLLYIIHSVGPCLYLPFLLTREEDGNIEILKYQTEGI